MFIHCLYTVYTLYTHCANTLNYSQVLACGNDYSAIVLVHNEFVNTATYKQVYKVLLPLADTGDDEAMPQYEFEPDIKNEVLEE